MLPSDFILSSSLWCRQASLLVFVVPFLLHRSVLFVTTASFAVKMNLSRTCWGIGVSTATISERNFKPVGKTFRLDVISQLIHNRSTIVFRESPTSKLVRFLTVSSWLLKAPCLPAEPSGGRAEWTMLIRRRYLLNFKANGRDSQSERNTKSRATIFCDLGKEQFSLQSQIQIT